MSGINGNDTDRILNRLDQLAVKIDTLSELQTELIEKLHDHGYINQTEFDDLLGDDDPVYDAGTDILD